MLELKALRSLSTAVIVVGLTSCNGQGAEPPPQAASSSQAISGQVASSAPLSSSTPDDVDLSNVVSSQVAGAEQGAEQQAQQTAVQQNMAALEDFGISVMRDFYAAGKHQGVQFAPRSWSGPEPYNGWMDTELESLNGGEFAVVRACSADGSCVRTGRVSLPNNAELTLKVDFDDHPGASAPDDVFPSKCSFYANGETLTYPCPDLLDSRKSGRVRIALLKSLAAAAANPAVSN